MNWCPHTCHFVSDIDIDEDEPTIDTNKDDEEDPLILEERDRLSIFNIDGYLEQESNPPQKINHTNYDYVLKYDPQRTESKEWTDIVPNQYHNYEDIFTRKDFDKLPERRPWDHAIDLTPGFKPVNCKTYPCRRKNKNISRSLSMKIFTPDELSHHPHLWHHHSFLSKRKMEIYAPLKIIES